jgi:hypothetical protein
VGGDEEAVRGLVADLAGDGAKAEAALESLCAMVRIRDVGEAEAGGLDPRAAHVPLCLAGPWSWPLAMLMCGLAGNCSA